MLQKLVRTTDDISIAIVRAVLGVVVFAHGAQKMLGWFGGRGVAGTIELYRQMGFSPSLGYLAIVLEFFCGLALIAGFLSRLAALGVITKLLTAVFTLNVQNGFFMNWNGSQKGEGFEFHLLAVAIGIAILIKGAGALSVDRALTKENS